MSSNIITQTIIVKGMTCVSCENRIERKLSATAGVISVKASFSSGKVIVTYDSNLINRDQLEEIIESLDYHVVKQAEVKKEKRNFDVLNLIGVIAVLFALIMLMRNLGGTGIFNAFPTAKEGMGLGMLFFIGMLTSVHCVAMCGGICLSQCVPKKALPEENPSRFATLRPSLLYNLGRVISYTVIGGIVGALGSVVSFSGSMKGIVQIIAGVFMVIMGLNMLNVFPWLRKLNPRMPKIFAKMIYSRGRSNSPLYIGLLNGLMPCGPLQAMQIYALSTGSPIKGALSMFLFSAGTVPLMFGFGALGSLLNKKFTAKMMKASAALVVILGIFMLNNGTTLAGIAMPSINSSAAVNKNVANVQDGVQMITTKLSSGRYEPITVQKGIPVKWTIQAEKGSINGCNNSIVIPKYNLQVDLHTGDNIIEFTPDNSGKIPYSCWMGMIRSQINVVDDISNINPQDTDQLSGTDAGAGLPNCCSGAGQGYNQGSQSTPSQTPGTNNSTDIFGTDGSNGTKGSGNVTSTLSDGFAVAKIENGVQKVEVNISKDGINPGIIVMQKDLKTEFVMNASDDEANSNLLFPLYNVIYPLKKGVNSAYLYPSEDFAYYTEDGKYYGYVKVVDDINKIDKEAIKKEVADFVPVVPNLNSGYPGSGGSAPSCH